MATRALKWGRRRETGAVQSSSDNGSGGENDWDSLTSAFVSYNEEVRERFENHNNDTTYNFECNERHSPFGPGDDNENTGESHRLVSVKADPDPLCSQSRTTASQANIADTLLSRLPS